MEKDKNNKNIINFSWEWDRIKMTIFPVIAFYSLRLDEQNRGKIWGKAKKMCASLSRVDHWPTVFVLIMLIKCQLNSFMILFMTKWKIYANHCNAYDTLKNVQHFDLMGLTVIFLMCITRKKTKLWKNWNLWQRKCENIVYGIVFFWQAQINKTKAIQRWLCWHLNSNIYQEKKKNLY